MDDKKRDSQSERRQESRHKVMLEGRIRLPAEDHDSAHLVKYAIIENLSHRGLCVYIPRVEKEHEPMLSRRDLKCAVSCEAGCVNPFYLCGTAVWVRILPEESHSGARLGIRLTDTDSEELDCLARFLEGFEARG